MQKPIYLFSMPRSGSTLLQRILNGHSAIATVSEPWILLPSIYARKTEGIYTDYRQDVSASAIEDFIETMPNGLDDYHATLRNMALDLYAKVSPPDVTYFLDKTPRYHLVVEDIMEIFKEGKHIFLWRNPLAVAASISNTYGGGRWNIYDFNVDFYKGLPNLIDTYQKNQGKEGVLAMRYEDFISDPEANLQQLLAFLEIDSLEVDKMLASFSDQSLQGGMGDPTGIKDYQKVNKDPLQKWKKSFSNPFRKAWGRKYLRWLGAERLAMMGYDLDELVAELNSVPNTTDRFLVDMLRTLVAPVYSLIRYLYYIYRDSIKYRIKIS